jgi:hypothetical protein
MNHSGWSISDLAVPHPAAIKLPAVSDLLIAWGVSLRHLDGPDQVTLFHFGVIFHAKSLGLFPYFFDIHGTILLYFSLKGKMLGLSNPHCTGLQLFFPSVVWIIGMNQRHNAESLLGVFGQGGEA